MPWLIIAAVPPTGDVMGLPPWAPNVLSVGGLITLIVVGLVTSKLWTKSQVDTLQKTHDREVANLKDRYDTHLSRTIELYQGRVNDAIRRENEWRDTAQTWQKVAQTLADGLEPMHEQNTTILAIVQQWQVSAKQQSERRPGRRT